MNHECYDFLHSWNRSTFFTKIWLKNLVKIPPTLISYYVTNSIGYYIVICFLSFMGFAQSVVSISCNYSLSGDDYNHIFTRLWCEAEMLSRWRWINAIYVSRTSWPMPRKSHVAYAIKYFMWNVSHCLQSVWYLYKITVSHSIALIVYKLYFHSTILKMI